MFNLEANYIEIYYPQVARFILINLAKFEHYVYALNLDWMGSK